MPFGTGSVQTRHILRKFSTVQQSGQFGAAIASLDLYVEWVHLNLNVCKRERNTETVLIRLKHVGKPRKLKTEWFAAKLKRTHEGKKPPYTFPFINSLTTISQKRHRSSNDQKWPKNGFFTNLIFGPFVPLSIYSQITWFVQVSKRRTIQRLFKDLATNLNNTIVVYDKFYCTKECMFSSLTTQFH